MQLFNKGWTNLGCKDSQDFSAWLSYLHRIDWYKGEIDADTSPKIEKQILVDEFDYPEFLEFAVENYSEMFGYINTGRVNIRIHRDIEGKMWFGVGWISDLTCWQYTPFKKNVKGEMKIISVLIRGVYNIEKTHK